MINVLYSFERGNELEYKTFYLPQRSILPLGYQLFARKYKPSQTVKYEKKIKSRDLGKTTVNPLLSPPGGFIFGLLWFVSGTLSHCAWSLMRKVRKNGKLN